MRSFFSPGKLLLTSEYVVLDGALALAVPTKWGQEFFVEKIPDGKSRVKWSALHQSEPWLEISLDYGKEEILTTNIPDSAAFILKLLLHIKQSSPTQLQGNDSYLMSTNLQFPPDFGLGSSSTLINNLADWAQIDAFHLNEKTLGGSGYDIAVAQKKSALLYQNVPERIIKPINFDPFFKNELIFIHLNQKQDSRAGINLYRSKRKSTELIGQFSALTEKALEAETLTQFSELMEAHEQQLSDFLKINTVQERVFSDCPSFVKSLGAWGGDFVMSSKFSGYQDYFRNAGYGTVFNYTDLII